MIMYAIRAMWNSIAPPNVCSAIELESVVAPKVIPVNEESNYKRQSPFFHREEAVCCD